MSQDVINWFKVNSAWHDIQISKSNSCCSFWLIVLNIIRNLPSYNEEFMTYWERRGYRRLSALWQWCKGNWPVVICRVNSFCILLEYFQKNLYSSTFKTTFLLLLQSFFGQYFTSSNFLSVTKLLLDYNSRILFTPLVAVRYKTSITL